MGKLWIHNSITDRLAMLQQTATEHQDVALPAIEKDWWVMVTLRALFRCGCKDFLLFKGGTSLSKGFGVIGRFSEDIDLAISHLFFGIDKTNKNQKDKLRKKAREYIHNTLSIELDEQMKSMGITGYSIENVTCYRDIDGITHPIDSDKDPTVILVHYPSIVEDDIAYILPRVKIEVSCLSMDVPVENREIKSMVAESFPEEDDEIRGMFRTVVPTRTFLEKIFLLAEEFQKEKPRYARMSRHLYDLERLMDTEYGKLALEDEHLYDAIVEHRRVYYGLKYVDYNKHSRDVISFLPPKDELENWRRDYENMQKYFIYAHSLSFDDLMDRMKELQRRLNVQ